jgi:hypothetical protein
MGMVRVLALLPAASQVLGSNPYPPYSTPGGTLRYLIAIRKNGEFFHYIVVALIEKK